MLRSAASFQCRGLTVKRLLSVLTLMFIAPAAFAGSATDEAFQNLADEYISDLDQLLARIRDSIGDHSADRQLDNVDAARAGGATRAPALNTRWRLPRSTSTRCRVANQVDAELLLNQLESDLWSPRRCRNGPGIRLYYISISGNAIYGLVARDYAPIETRLMSSATSRLRADPALPRTVPRRDPAGTSTQDSRRNRDQAKSGAELDHRQHDRPRDGRSCRTPNSRNSPECRYRNCQRMQLPIIRPGSKKSCCRRPRAIFASARSSTTRSSSSR